ncbi:MAG: hypothetical protein A2Y25_00730 [Candidatus Melainabacteria bacterium GWF2_37_15]|nr:MAG: hypothetical protein A2Y25_00730 [Candidatus Melainabacteria bacterium GWF2_37_15]
MEIISRGNVPQKKVPAFKGLSVGTNLDGTKYHTFYQPSLKPIQLEVVRVKMDEKGNYEAVGKPEILPAPSTNSFLKMWKPGNDEKSKILNIKGPESKLAYRFRDGENIILDEVRRVDLDGNGKEDFNLAWDPARPDRIKNIAIYHLMPDMIGPELDKYGKPMPDRRTHFNNFGGEIKDIITRLDHIQGMGNTMILSTPVFANGPANSNGYWTKNAYQVDQTRGKLADFKNLQIDLFKRGMGFIADGAFVNESWEGIHIKDVVNYGSKTQNAKAESPFLNWFYPSESFVEDRSGKLQLQLLPNRNKKATTDNHIGIKIINGPYRLKYVEGKQDPIVEENPDYKGDNEHLPTKIQIFDRRYVSIDKQNDNEIVQRYNVEPKDYNELKNFDDSVQLFSAEVEHESIEKKLEKEVNKPINAGDFIKKTDWGRHFEIVHPKSGSNVDLWDGQNDIPKLRFFVSKTERRELKENDPVKLKKLDKACSQVQDNLVQIGKYWTGEVEKTLSEYTAKELHKKIGENPNAQTIMQAIQELKKEKAIPPESVDLIKKEEIENLLAGNYKLSAAPLPESIMDGIMSLPLEAIEFPDEICSFLSSPYLKKLATTPDKIGVSRYEIFKNGNYGDMHHKKMDDEVYKKIDKLVKEIIKDSPTLEGKMLDDKGNLSPEGKAIFRVLSSDVTKYFIVKGLANINPLSPKYNPKELAEKSFINWAKAGRTKGSHENEANSLIDAISAGLDKNITEQDKEEFQKYLETRVEGLNDNTLKIAKLIINKTESGLNWRIDAAKDAANLQPVYKEDHPREQNTFAENWLEVIKVWRGFLKGVQEENPKQYSIAEYSNLSDNFKGDPRRPDGYAKGNYKHAGEVVSKFIEQTGFTTESNYTYLFGFLPDLTRSSYEDKNNAFDYAYKKLINGWGGSGDPNTTPGFLRYGPVDSVLYSHVFTDNHDMKRSLHILSVDEDEYKTGNIDKTKLERWKDTKLGEKVSPSKEYDQVLEQTIPLIKKEILDKAFAGEEWWTKENQMAFTCKEWNNGWIDNDDRIKKAGLSDKFKEYRKRINDLNKVDPNKKVKYGPALVAADAIMESYKQAGGQDIKAVKAAIDAVAMKAPEQFGRRAVNHNWEDIVEEAKLNEKLDKQQLEQLAKKVHVNFVKPGMERIKAVELYKQILPGCPTMYNGQEMAETGLESDGKNMSLYNRNRVHFEWLKRDEKDPIVQFNNELKDINSLRKNSNLSPLIDGQMLMLQRTQNDKIIPLYRYNKDRDVIAIINAAGIHKTEHGDYKVSFATIPFIDTTRDDKNELGVPGGLKPGTVYINARDEKDGKYVINDKGQLVKADGKQIEIKDNALLLYREEEFNPKQP